NGGAANPIGRTPPARPPRAGGFPALARRRHPARVLRPTPTRTPRKNRPRPPSGSRPVAGPGVLGISFLRFAPPGPIALRPGPPERSLLTGSPIQGFGDPVQFLVQVVQPLLEGVQPLVQVFRLPPERLHKELPVLRVRAPEHEPLHV